jgi:hypothetical protein
MTLAKVATLLPKPAERVFQLAANPFGDSLR